MAPFPHPYGAAVAISNDCEFMSWRDFLAIYRYLNVEVGLEVSTSLFFFVTNALCHSSFGYFDQSGGPAAESETIRELVRAGYIDTIHAYGDFDDGSFTREHAARVAAECDRHGLRFPLWTNHGSEKNIQNLGHRELAVYQRGDDPTSDAYHLDLLRTTGARYFWVDDGYQTAVADGTPLVYEELARDGTTLTLVRRYRGLVGKPAPMAGSLSEQMTVDDLDRLVHRGEACIYYQHLGAWRRTGPTSFEANRPPYFDEAGTASLGHLAALYHRGDCLVTTPARLIRYLVARDTVDIRLEGDTAILASPTTKLDAGSLEGLTFVASSVRDVVFEDDAGRRVPVRHERHPTRDRREVVTLPWKPLVEFSW